MSKPAFWQLSERDRRALFSEAGERLRIPAHMMEKDAWVCWTLREIFTLPDARAHFIFKGGTSFSKVWKVIHRFSEDIDISISREWLGFSGARDPERAVSRKQRAKLLEELSATCAEKLKTDVAPALPGEGDHPSCRSSPARRQGDPGTILSTLRRPGRPVAACGRRRGSWFGHAVASDLASFGAIQVPNGARGRTRTGISFRKSDFKSEAYTISPPGRL